MAIRKIAWICGILAFAAATAAMAEDAQMPRIAETLSVDIVNLDVIVTDAHGTRVRNLTKDDFLIFENGRPVSLTNFNEVVPPPPLPPGTVQAPDLRPNMNSRSTVLFIDESSIGPMLRNRLLRALDEFATRNLQPGDRVMVVPWNGGFHAPLRFFTEPEQVHAALRKEIEHPMPSSVQRGSRDASLQTIAERDCEDAITLARDYASSSRADAERVVSALRAIIGLMGAMPGKRALIIASEWLPQQPGREMFDALSSRGCNSAGLESAGDNGDAIHRLANAANAHNVALYAIDTELVRGFGSALFTVGPLPRNAGLFHQYTYPDIATIGSRNTINSFRLLADATGGYAVFSTNAFSAALARIADDITSYYSIAYRSAASGLGPRAIEVKLKNPSLKARTRRSFTPSTFGEELDDRVIASLLSVGVRSDFDVSIAVGPIQSCDLKSCSVPVIVTTSQADKPATLAFAVRDAHGNVSAVKHAPCEHSPCVVSLLVDRGRTSIAVGAADEASQLAGFARLTLTSVNPPANLSKETAWF